MKNLPVYKISIDDEFSDGEDLGISQIAFVQNPAIKIKGVAFSAQNDDLKQLFADKLKYRITAPVMTPSTIYRSDETGEYYVEFTDKEIERIYSKFMRNISNRNVFNLEHDNAEKMPAYILESWIVDNPEKDKSFLEYGIKVPKGSIMMTAQITNPEIYNELIANEQFAFSIEGFLGLSLSDIINKKNNLNTQETMNEKMMLPDGEYTIKDKIYVIKDGVVVEVKDIAPVDEEMVEDKKDCPEKEYKDEEVKEEEKEEMQEELPVEEMPVDEVVEDKKDFYTKDEVDAKFDELYQMIAELKANVDDAPVEALMNKEKMSAHKFLVYTSNELRRKI